MSVQTTAAPPAPKPRRPGIASLLATLAGKVIRDPVQHGRLRDVGWPFGLRAVVALGCVAYAVGGAVVVFSSLIRRSSPLTVPGTLSSSIPRGYVWLLVLLLLLALALLQTAALHAVWWFRWLATVASALMMGLWGFRYTPRVGGLVETAASVVLVLALVVLVLARRRRAFAWWEFPVVLALLGLPVILGLEVLSRRVRPIGSDFAPALLLEMTTLLGPLALPVVVAAGLSVAEISVSATLWATRLTQRFAGRRSAYAILAVLVALRLAQSGWQLAGWDFVSQGGDVFATWALLALVLGALALLVSRLARGSSPLVVSELPDRMAGMALPLGGVIVGFGLGSLLLLAGVFTIATAVHPAVAAELPSSWLEVFRTPTGSSIFRAGLGVALVGLALRSARRGRPGTGLLLCAVAVMLWARVVRWASGGVLNAGDGADVLNLLATALLLVLIAGFLLRRTLTPQRALTLSSALVLSALLGSHDFISDPAGALLGFSGAALVLFGLTWGLLTDSDFANRGSRRFPLPSRVLLVLANVILAIGVLAYTSLTRDQSVTVNLDAFATLGDEVLGTALMAATFIAVLSAVRERREIS